ncbi:CrcB family protein [Apilactobacillus apisilvae]|uniref:Fluoride-specific ion channel FluC n=1 Tax=Apilactobacillus apisilvae TaxID=2923364 RepID=A0ABY4PGR2_9LACO|nr:CrcB family protein [Apilactobacillus apisilvae]UQS84767.1 CrcB family protein [Apilactobacillus apisilvae]
MLYNVLIVGLGASIGSLLRFLVTKILNELFHKISLPISTLFINVSGSFLLGLVNHQLPKNMFTTILFIAILGGYTTFSTYIDETIQLRNKRQVLSLIYYLLTAILGVLAALLGYVI